MSGGLLAVLKEKIREEGGGQQEDGTDEWDALMPTVGSADGSDDGIALGTLVGRPLGAGVVGDAVGCPGVTVGTG